MANPNYIFQGIPGETVRIACTDEAQQFAAANYMSGIKPAIAAVITVEDALVRFCLGGETPTQGAAGTGHILYTGQSLRLANGSAIQTFSFINHTNADDAVLQVTFEFEAG